MITVNQTASTNDTDLILICKILNESTTYRFCDNGNGIELSGNVYYGDVLGVPPLYSEGVEMSYGGGIGRISALELELVRFSSATEFDGFFNEYFPATSGKRLVGREVHIGWCWSGATLESQITWLKKFYIENYSYDAHKITLYCVETRELELIELPYYEVQKSFDNGISYFTNAPDDNYGVPLPVLYGDFAVFDYATSTFRLSPAILVDKSTAKFVVSTNKCNSTSASFIVASEYAMFKPVSSLKSYVTMYKATGTSAQNTNYIHTVIMQYSLGQILGNIEIPFREASSYSDITDLANAMDGLETTYVQVDGGDVLALRCGVTATSSELGATGTTDVHIAAYYRISSDSVNSRSYTINFRNETLPSPANGAGATSTISGTTVSTTTRFAFGNSTTGKKDTVLPWTLEELLNLEYFVSNNDATPSNRIRVYRGYLYLSNIKMINIADPASIDRTIIRGAGR